MSFSEAISSVFSKYASFSGRARRSEYWYFVLFNILVSLVIGVITALGTNGDSGSMNAGSILSSVYSLAVFLPSLAVCVRRLHDIGKSGWNYFIALIPLIGWIVLIVWLAREGEPGPNQYGPNPKEPFSPDTNNF
ncbi:MAG: DUF805 domain-containing protein [Anaerolineaceae bacterium]|nr:DUF805 domain-containing protein [Anaerolineaceae bacterium]